MLKNRTNLSKFAYARGTKTARARTLHYLRNMLWINIVARQYRVYVTLAISDHSRKSQVVLVLPQTEMVHTSTRGTSSKRIEVVRRR